jgi:glycosyltransferase involved in cell wall biosynthesis
MEKHEKMEFGCDLLYITFIDLDGNVSTGSSVRPRKMLEAFEEMGLSIKVLSGIKTNRPKRRKNIEEILRWLETKRPRLCYVEPPSGPFYDRKDLVLLKKLRRQGVPVGLFYRDAYWMFPEYGADGRKLPFSEKVKQEVIKWIQRRDLRVFRRTCSHIFFPSSSMAFYFNFPSQSALPPGCVIRGGVEQISQVEEKKEILTFIFVGGAARNHGTFLTLEAFEKANQNGVISKLIYICPECQWNKIKGEVYKENYAKWLSIFHVSGDEKLAPFYEKADLALLAAPKTEYRDFAVPVKIYEYISYGKPILVTDCNETKKAVLENQVGWSVPDDALSVCSKIIFLHEHQEEIFEKKKRCREACLCNAWARRAETVIQVLSAKESQLEQNNG